MVVDVERSLGYDPLYALRLLVDVALRARSPAVNDPTTAVRALDEIEPVLRTAAGLPLGPRTLGAGAGAVVLNVATWADVADLALLEITLAGAGQPQVTRRLTALVDDLAADVPATRLPLLGAARAGSSPRPRPPTRAWPRSPSPPTARGSAPPADAAAGDGAAPAAPERAGRRPAAHRPDVRHLRPVTPGTTPAERPGAGWRA